MRVDGGLGAAQRGGERLGPLAVVPRAVVAADRVVVGDRAAGRDERIGDGLLDGPPLPVLLPAARRLASITGFFGPFPELGGA